MCCLHTFNVIQSEVGPQVESKQCRSPIGRPGKLLFEDGQPLTFGEFLEGMLMLRGSNQTTVKDGHGMAWVLHDAKRVEMLGSLVGLLVPGCFCNENFSEWLGRMWWNVGCIPQDIVTLRKFTADEFSHLHTVRGSLTCRVAAISNLGFVGYL